MSEIKARVYVLFCSCRLCSDSGCNVVGYVPHGHLLSVLHFTFNSLVAKLLQYLNKTQQLLFNISVGSGSSEQFVGCCFRSGRSGIYSTKYAKGFGQHRWRYVCYTVAVLVVHIMCLMSFMKLTEER